MRLHRFVTVTFGSSPKFKGTLHAEYDTVVVETSPVTFNGNPDPRLLVTAQLSVDEELKLDSEGYWMVPELPRVACERALESLVNTLCVLGRTSRSISSAPPFVALSELQASEQDVLAGCKGLRGLYGRFVGFSTLDITDPKHGKALGDRLPAVTLMAEALSTNHPVGRYRELLRFLEFAFAMPLSQVEKKLSQFLDGAALGYTRAEVKEWFGYRDAAMHGDLRKAKSLVVEADVRHFMPRLEQAAYDVLFNKLMWHSPSSERREILLHDVATTERTSRDFRITRGRDANLVTQVLDPFGSYPVDLAGIIGALPDAMWAPRVEGSVGKGQVLVRDAIDV